MTKRVASALFLSVFTLACGDGASGPENEIPDLRSYDYFFETPQLIGAPIARTCTGTFDLTYAAADSIAGRWNVTCKQRYGTAQLAPYRTDAKFGSWNVDAYLIYADGNNLTAHRFARNNGILSCVSARIPYNTSSGGISSVVGACSLSPR